MSYIEGATSHQNLLSYSFLNARKKGKKEIVIPLMLTMLGGAHSIGEAFGCGTQAKLHSKRAIHELQSFIPYRRFGF